MSFNRSSQLYHTHKVWASNWSTRFPFFLNLAPLCHKRCVLQDQSPCDSLFLLERLWRLMCSFFWRFSWADILWHLFLWQISSLALVAFLQLCSLPCRSHSSHRLLCCNQERAKLNFSRTSRNQLFEDLAKNIKFSRSCFFGSFALIVALTSLVVFIDAVVRESIEAWSWKRKIISRWKYLENCRCCSPSLFIVK